MYNAKTTNLFRILALFLQKRLIKCKGGDIINRKTGGVEDLAMLLEFSCSNHKSILDKVVFSALAGKDTSHEERVKNFDSFRVLKGAIIYGANGSGKSNFIDAISFVKNLVSDSIRHQPGQGIFQRPHKLAKTGKSSYSIQFVKSNTRYAYGFVLENFVVVEEYLYYFPNGRQTKIFERTNDTFVTGTKFKNRLSNCNEVLKPNRLLLSCAANFSNAVEIEDAFRFFNEDIVIYGSENQMNWMNYSLRKIHEDEKIKDIVLAFLEDLHTGIRDIKVDIDEKTLDESELPPFLSDEFRNQIMQQKVSSFTTKIVYDDFETDLMSEESAGIQKLFSILCPLIDIMINGKVLICDELETNLHESLVYGIVRLFTQLRTEEFAQIIFSTHDTSLLNLDLFRRDQIWFTELSKETRCTELYSLAEIKNVRKDEVVGKGYIAGKYGAIPMLNLDFANVISKL